MTTPQYLITAGPSREELFDALRLRDEGRTVWFTLDKVNPDTTTSSVNVVASFHVESIGAEDGNPKSWLVRLVSEGQLLGGKLGFNVSYDTTRRTGRGTLILD